MTSDAATAPRTRRLLLPAAVYAAILGMSSLPGDTLGGLGLPELLSYVGHAVEYGGLGAALRWALDGARRPLVVTVLFGLALGALDETYQSTVSGRDPSLVDLAVDVVAVAAAALLCRRLQHGGNGKTE